MTPSERYVRAVLERMELTRAERQHVRAQILAMIATRFDASALEPTFDAICFVLDSPADLARDLGRARTVAFEVTEKSRARFAQVSNSAIFAIACVLLLLSFISLDAFARPAGAGWGQFRVDLPLLCSVLASGLRHCNPLALAGVALFAAACGLFMYIQLRMPRRPKAKPAKKKPTVAALTPIEGYLSRLSDALPVGWYHRHRIVPELRSHIEEMQKNRPQPFASVDEIEAVFGQIPHLAVSIQRSLDLRKSIPQREVLCREQAPRLLLVACFLVALAFGIVDLCFPWHGGRINLANSEDLRRSGIIVRDLFQGALHGQWIGLVFVAVLVSAVTLLVASMVAWIGFGSPRQEERPRPHVRLRA